MPAVLSKCKWCGNTRESPNPLIGDRDRYPMRGWRRAGGVECTPCNTALVADPRTSGQLTELAAAMKAPDDDEEAVAKKQLVVEIVEACIKERNESGKKRLKLPARKPIESVEAAQVNKHEQREFLGFFWRMKQYKKEEDYKKPTKKEITRIKHNGATLVGVLRTKGLYVPGVIEIWNTDDKVVKRGIVMGTSGECDVEELGDKQQMGIESLRTTVKASTKTGGILLHSKRASSLMEKAETDAEDADDDALLFSLWDTPEKPTRARPESEDDEANGADISNGALVKRKKMAKAIHCDEVCDSVSATLEDGAIEHSKSTIVEGTRKRLKRQDAPQDAVQMADEVLTNIIHLKRDLSQSQCWNSLDRTYVEKLLSQATNILKHPKRLAEDWDGHAADHKGMSLLASLTDEVRKLPEIRQLLVCAYAEMDGKLESLEALRSSMNAVTALGMELPSELYQQKAQRFFGLHLPKIPSVSFGPTAAVLNLAIGDVDSDPEAMFSVDHIPTETATTLQRKVATRFILDMCRVEDEGSDLAKDNLAAFLDKIPEDLFADVSFAASTGQLKLVVRARCCITAEDVEKGKEALDAINNTNHVFNKAIKYFHTGMQIAASASEHFIAMQRTDEIQTILDRVKKVIDEVPTDATLWELWVLSEQNTMNFQRALEDLAGVKANSIAAVQLKFATKLENISDKLTDLARAASEKFFNDSAGQVTPHVSKICQILMSLPHDANVDKPPKVASQEAGAVLLDDFSDTESLIENISSKVIAMFPDHESPTSAAGKLLQSMQAWGPVLDEVNKFRASWEKLVKNVPSLQSMLLMTDASGNNLECLHVAVECWRELKLQSITTDISQDTREVAILVESKFCSKVVSRFDEEASRITSFKEFLHGVREMLQGQGDEVKQEENLAGQCNKGADFSNIASIIDTCSQEDAVPLENLRTICSKVQQLSGYWDEDKIVVMGMAFHIDHLSTMPLLFRALQSLTNPKVLDLEKIVGDDVIQSFDAFIDNCFAHSVDRIADMVTALSRVGDAAYRDKTTKGLLYMLDENLQVFWSIVLKQTDTLVDRCKNFNASKGTTTLQGLVKQFPGNASHTCEILRTLDKAATEVQAIMGGMKTLRALYEWLKESLVTRMKSFETKHGRACFRAAQAKAENCLNHIDTDCVKDAARHLSDWSAIQACEKTLPAKKKRSALCTQVVAGLRKRQWHSFSENVAMHITKCSESND